MASSYRGKSAFSVEVIKCKQCMYSHIGELNSKRENKHITTELKSSPHTKSLIRLQTMSLMPGELTSVCMKRRCESLAADGSGEVSVAATTATAAAEVVAELE